MRKISTAVFTFSLLLSPLVALAGSNEQNQSPPDSESTEENTETPTPNLFSCEPYPECLTWPPNSGDEEPIPDPDP